MKKEKVKIVAIAASPSKGWNSDGMLDAFIDGIKETNLAEVHKVYMNDIEMDHYCHINREGAMDHEDEFKKLIEEIMSSDGLVVATPTYNFSVPAGLKNLIDRMSFMSLDYRKLNWLKQPTGRLHFLKNFYLVSGGTPTLAQKLLFFLFPPFWLKVVFKYYGAKNIGSIYEGPLNSRRRSTDLPKLMKKCRRAGKKYAKKLV